jgi:hypothetical protein
MAGCFVRRPGGQNIFAARIPGDGCQTFIDLIQESFHPMLDFLAARP